MAFSRWLLLSVSIASPILANPKLPALTARDATAADTNIFTSCCKDAQEATVFSLVYGLPLIAFANQTTKVFSAVGGANQIDTQSELASLSSAAVVKPNVDTLYSRVIIDLSKKNLVLTVPNITDRFYIFPFYDLFGDNFADISPVNGSLPGDYLLQRAEDVSSPIGLQNATRGSKYQGVVNFPTSYGTMLIRILLIHNTTRNLDIVHKYQSEYKLKEVSRPVTSQSAPADPSLKSVFTNGTRVISSAQSILSLLAQVASFNQPELLTDRYRVASILGYAGLVNGKYQQPATVNLDQAFSSATQTVARVVANPKNINNVGNGWELAYPPAEGNFGTNYASRANIAQNGYQQLQPYIALYPGFNGSSFRSYYLKANESFLFTFSRRPPVKSSGFWSLTVYGADQYLVPNTLNRFEVGDRSNITYDNGKPIYGPGSDPSVTQTPFKILMQPANIQPPKNWTSNWLPSPAGGGDLSFILRFYVAKPALTNGVYVYPKVETIKAIRA